MTKKYNLGISLLKVLAMIMVVTLHFLGHGGLLEATDKFSTNYYIAYLLELVCIPAVNLFALTSGYTGVNSSFKPNKIAYIWFETLFYVVVIAFIFSRLGLISLSWVEKSYLFIPILTSQYWYVTAFVLMKLIAPFINSGINKCDVKDITKLVVLVVGVLCISSLLGDPFKLNRGYGALWLCVMYFVGALISKIDIDVSFNTLVLCYMGIVGLNYMVLIKYMSHTDYVLNYDSLLCVIQSVVMLIMFTKLNIKTNYFNKFMSTNLAAYLIGDNKYVRHFVIKNSCVALARLNPLVMVMSLVGMSLVLYITTTFIDRIRLKVFEFCKVSKLCLVLTCKFGSK